MEHRFLNSSRKAILLFLIGLALTGCGSSSSHDPVSPKALVLKQSDAPPGFKLSSGSTHFVSTSQDARTSHIKASELIARGRVSGYEAQLQRSRLIGRTTLPSGVLIIDSYVSTWKASSGAAWGFAHAVHSIRSNTRFHFTTESSPKVGDQALAFKLNFDSSGLLFTSQTLAFRRGQYAATITVVGTKNKVQLSDALPYGHLLDQRIKKIG